MSGSVVVTVVVPVLNGADTIRDTLTGLTHQACHGLSAVEILVVDNGSTDATRSIVAQFPVTLLDEPKRGPSAARNRALHVARGAVVAHLDADAIPTRRWLTEIVAPFADPKVLQVAGRMVGDRPTTAVERYYARRFLDREAENATAEGFPFAASGNMAVRREAALAIGGWDEDFIVAQDVDLSYRLLRRFGSSIHYQRNALALVRSSRTPFELMQRAFKYGQGRARLWLRHREAVQFGPARAARIVAGLAVLSVWPHMVRAAKHAGRATDADVQDAVCHRLWNWWLWRGFMSMLHHREWRQLAARD